MNASEKFVACLFLTALLSASCASSAPNASSAPPAPPATAGSPQQQERVAEQHAATSVPAEVVQLVIDLPALQKYYHVDDAPNRKPLFVLRNELIDGEPQLSKFDEPVKFATCDELKTAGKPYLEFTKFEMKDDAASVVFRYRVEGIEGRLTLGKQDDGAWRVREQELVEARFTDRGCVKANGGKNAPK